MRTFVLFVAVSILALAPFILGQSPQPPPVPLPPVNSEASKAAAKALLREVWPNLEESVRLNPSLRSTYDRILQTFQAAAVQADTLAQSRVGKELLAQITGKNAKYTRKDILNMLRTEYAAVDVGTAAMVANEVLGFDEDTDEDIID